MGGLPSKEAAELHEAAVSGDIDYLTKLVLLLSREYINARDSKGRSALYRAAGRGHTECVQQLLAAGADYTLAASMRWTPLHKAAARGHTGTVAALVAAGAPASLPDENGLTPLDLARLQGHAVCAAFLESLQQPHSQPANGMPLVRAAERGDLATAAALAPAVSRPYLSMAVQAAAGGGHPEVLRILLTAGSGASIDSADEEGFTALRRAARSGCVRCTRVLLNHGAKPNLADCQGRTALYWAAACGAAACIAALAEHGADVNARVKGGYAPLHVAAFHGYTACVEELIRAGADRCMHVHGKNAARLAAECGHTACVRALEPLQPAAGQQKEFSCSALLAAAQHGDCAAVSGMLQGSLPQQCLDRALRVAAKHGHAGCVHELLAAGARVDAADDCGLTALAQAARHGDVSCVGVLLSAGASINRADSQQRTALYWSALCGSAECVAALVQAGADLNQAVQGGFTPLHVAAFSGHAACVRQLLETGADASIRVNGKTAADLAAESGHSVSVAAFEAHAQRLPLRPDFSQSAQLAGSGGTVQQPPQPASSSVQPECAAPGSPRVAQPATPARLAPAAGQVPDEEPAEEDVCICCRDAQATVGALHGRTVHRCLCVACAEVFQERKALSCPLCRERIDAFVLDE